MTAAKRRAPQRDARGVDPFELLDERDRGVPVLVLVTDAYELARMATAVAEVPIVEHHGADSRLREPLRGPVQLHVAHAGQSVGQDHARARGCVWTARLIEPGRELGLADRDPGLASGAHLAGLEFPPFHDHS